VQESNKRRVKSKSPDEKKNNEKNKPTPAEGDDPILNYKFEFTKENIHSMSFICANKVLYQLYFNLPKTMKILQEMDVRINLILNYGELINGYIGHDKIDEVYIGMDLIESERILRVLNKKHLKPAIYLHSNFNENLSYKLEELVYPCEVAKVYSSNSDFCKMCSIYKIYANPHLLTNRDQDMPITLNKEDILTERNAKLIALARMKGMVDDYVVSDQVIETYFKMNLKDELRKNIISFFECLYNNKLDECVVVYRRIDKDYYYEKFRDQDFKRSFKNLYLKIRSKISSKLMKSEDENFSFIVDTA
jgi:hypothetical protein